MSERAFDDEMLIRRAQGGDRSAFDMLVSRHEIRAYQYAFRLTRNSEEAADVVAEAFIRVYNAIATFKGQSSFATWLYRILTNCFLDFRKKIKPVSSLDVASQIGEGDLERQIEDPGPTPHDESERLEREERVERAVNRLPEYQRAMIVMYHVDMLTYEEIAVALDLPIGTVKSRLNRARLTLRDYLIKDQELFRT
ncbi:MAG TPA: sigma-70 family RNA polymerase sigma factor [Fimbriimonadaceae bacterium]|nr:sigma-70 family RNA polymerase sigma factor [Fimbriimonadaceae bacterium]